MNRREQAKQRKRKARQERLRVAKHQHSAHIDEVADEPEVFADDPLIPTDSAFATERLNRAMARAMTERSFENHDDMQAFLHSRFVGRAPDPIDPTDQSIDARERAQELAYRSMDATRRSDALQLATRALQIDANCVDALTVLACVGMADERKRIVALEEAVRIGERELGGATYFEEHRGRFWGLVLTRPYMRTRQVLADTLVQSGRVRDALGHYQAMLDLNTNDNQGIRDTLVGLALEVRDLDAARQVFDRFPEDNLAIMRWARILERWMSGDVSAAARSVRAARIQNPYVVSALLGAATSIQPQEWIPGTQSEAQLVAACLGRAWRSDRAALEWLREGAAFTTADERSAALRSYSEPLSALLHRGEVRGGIHWSDYVGELALGPAHVPELIRMACQPALHEFDGTTRPVWAPLHAWRALGQLRATESIESLAGLLRENAYDDWIADEVPRVLAMIGPAAARTLGELLADPSADEQARICAADGLDKLAELHPQTRLAFLDSLREELRRAEKNPPELNGVMIEQLVELGGEARDLPLIERAFETGRIDESLSGERDDIRERLMQLGS